MTIVAALVSRDKCRTEQRHRHLDVYGAVLGAIAVGALVWALVEGPESGFGSATVVAGFVLAGVALAAFLWVESRLAEPMMPLSLFRIRELSVANLSTFFVYAALGSALFFVVAVRAVGARLLADEAGLVFVPVSIVLWAARQPLRPLRPTGSGPRPFLIGGPGADRQSAWRGSAASRPGRATGSTSFHRCSSSPSALRRRCRPSPRPR